MRKTRKISLSTRYALTRVSHFGLLTGWCIIKGIAEQYAAQWTSLATTSSSIALEYGSSQSGIIYNLYADKLLQTNLINGSVSCILMINWWIHTDFGFQVFDLQTSFYASQFSTLASASPPSFGLPLSFSNPTTARSGKFLCRRNCCTHSEVPGRLVHVRWCGSIKFCTGKLHRQPSRLFDN